MALVIPIFIPHEGCPHVCVFCNQHRITGAGTSRRVGTLEVVSIIETWLARVSARQRDEVQVAFYGGSFTGLAMKRQQELLGAVQPYLEDGTVQSIRLSTRPDYISPEIVDFLLASGVQLVELGVQSMADAVLAASNRGHLSSHVNRAVKFLRVKKLQVGIQLMLGLPGECRKTLRESAYKVIALRPDCVRIYPVLVLSGSPLAKLYQDDKYTPHSLAYATLLAAWLKERFDRYGIPIIRLGLQATPELEEAILAGPYHPSFGELVRARLMLQKTRSILADVSEGEKVILKISEKDQSAFRGIRSGNMKRLEQAGLLEKFILHTDPMQPRQTVVKMELIENI